MARHDGFAVLSSVRSDPVSERKPRIAMFSNSQDETDAVRARELRATEYWPKPTGHEDYRALFSTLSLR